jgi:cytochrome c5
MIKGVFIISSSIIIFVLCYLPPFFKFGLINSDELRRSAMTRMRTPSLIVIFLALILVITWGSGGARAADGKVVYDTRCAACHGATGQGDGPGAAIFKTKPQDFANPAFWQGNVDQKIYQAVTMGYGEMGKMDLSPDEIKAVSAYITQRFKP